MFNSTQAIVSQFISPTSLDLFFPQLESWMAANWLALSSLVVACLALYVSWRAMRKSAEWKTYYEHTAWKLQQLLAVREHLICHIAGKSEEGVRLALACKDKDKLRDALKRFFLIQCLNKTVDLCNYLLLHGFLFSKTRNKEIIELNEQIGSVLKEHSTKVGEAHEQTKKLGWKENETAIDEVRAALEPQERELLEDALEHIFRLLDQEICQCTKMG